MKNLLQKVSFRQRFLLTFLVCVVVGGSIVGAFYSKTSFAEAVGECNITASNMRFSCYRAVFEEHSDGDVKSFIQEIERDENLNFHVEGDASYAIFGTNCHTYYHALGDFVATHEQGEDVSTLLSLGPSDCTSGYLMGLYKRIALQQNFDSTLLKEFYEVCPEGSENQCAHEIGHVLHDKYTKAILGVIDDISAQEYELARGKSYQYVTFEQPDLSAPFEECDEILEDTTLALVKQCYTGVGHNLFLFSEFSPDGYTTQIQECSEVEGENRNNCFAFLLYRIGINHGATEFLAHDFDGGNVVCRNATQETGAEGMMEHCYLGIGGGIGLLVDSEYANDDITDENIVVVKEQLTEYLLICEQAPEEFQNSCFAGLFGTRFAKLYDLLNLYHPDVEKLRPEWQDFEVVG